MSLPLAGKIAVVTGSSRSIGAAVARKLASDGANVVVNYATNSSAATLLVTEINTTSAGQAISVQADASNIAGTQKLLDAAINEWGRLDILVLNAARVDPETSLAELEEKFYDDHFNANVKTPLFTVKAAAPLLKPGGRIILFSTSLTAHSGITPNFLIYAATKGAIEQITRVLAKEYGGRGITVNCIAPGPIDTELFRYGKPESLIKSFEDMHPAKRIGRTDEVAPVVAFLASDAASWVNGQNLMVNGGWIV